MMIFSQ